MNADNEAQSDEMLLNDGDGVAFTRMAGDIPKPSKTRVRASRQRTVGAIRYRDPQLAGYGPSGLSRVQRLPAEPWGSSTDRVPRDALSDRSVAGGFRTWAGGGGDLYLGHRQLALTRRRPRCRRLRVPFRRRRGPRTARPSDDECRFGATVENDGGDNLREFRTHGQSMGRAILVVCIRRLLTTACAAPCRRAPPMGAC